MVKDGRAPAAIKLGPRITVWKTDDVGALMEAMASWRPEREPSTSKFQLRTMGKRRKDVARD